MRRQTDKPITITGEEKRMAVESPRGNLVKDENMKITRRPPVMAIATRSHPILKVPSIHLFYQYNEIART